jgi:Domain of Unknown Function (DUF1080)
MKFLIPLLALSTIAIAEPNALTDAEKSAGWRLLFDGKTTNGWVAIGKTTFPSKGWIVQDGTLKTVAKGGGGDIVTNERFDDFELEWEWRIAQGGNSGIKYNLPDPSKGVGCEYQLIDDAGHIDAKLNGGTRTTASLYDVLKPADDKKLKPAGEWNSSRIVVKGNHVEHWLNGAKTVEFEFGSEALKEAVAKSKFKNTAGWGVKTKSPILLQDHGDEIALRSIKIKASGSGN